MGSTWIVAAPQAKLPREGVLAVYPRGVAVLLVRNDDVVHAVANRCPHMSCPLEGGAREGFVLTCPCHDWRIDVRTGGMIEAPEVRVPVFPVKYEGEDILVELPV